MQLDVSDGMFMVTSGGSDLRCEPIAGLVTSDGSPESFLTVVAQDQFRPVNVKVERTDVPPPLPDNYTAYVELSVHAPGGLTVEDFEAERTRVITRKRGDLRLRVSVRRIAPPRSDERPAEFFTISAWPAAPAPAVSDERPGPFIPPPVPVVRTTRPGDLVASPELDAAGVEAANRLGQLLADPVPDQDGSCSATVLVPLRPRKTYNWTGPVANWAGHGCSGGYSDVVVGEEAWAYSHDERLGAFNGTRDNGQCRRTVIAADPPRSVVCAWEWTVPPDGAAVASLDQQVPLLAEPSLLTLTYAPEPDEDGRPWTRIELTHTRLPSTWAPLLQTYWSASLSRMPEHSRSW